MRILVGVVGALLFVVGLLVLVSGATSAFRTADNLGSDGSDWTCSADATSSRCDFGIGGVPRDHAAMTGDLAVTVAGGAVAICGAIFVSVGFSGGRAQPAAPAAAHGPYATATPRPAPLAGPPLPHHAPGPAAHQSPPDGTAPRGGRPAAGTAVARSGAG